MNEPFLLEIEDFLTNAGEGELSLRLNKLQQDIALKFAEHESDPEPVNPDDLVITTPLMENFKPLTMVGVH